MNQHNVRFARFQGLKACPYRSLARCASRNRCEDIHTVGQRAHEREVFGSYHGLDEGNSGNGQLVEPAVPVHVFEPVNVCRSTLENSVAVTSNWLYVR